MNNQEPETRKCDLCGETLSRMWLKKSPEVQWQFNGDYAHLECYIDLIVKRKIDEHFKPEKPKSRRSKIIEMLIGKSR